MREGETKRRHPKRASFREADKIYSIRRNLTKEMTEFGATKGTQL